MVTPIEHIEQWWLERLTERLGGIVSNCICGAQGIDLDSHECVPSLKKKIEGLVKQLDYAKDDLLRLDGACWYCLQPEIEYAWRHDHDGDGRFHWHHRLDPGDGLVNDCEHSEMYERIWQEAQEAMKAESQP